MRIIFSLFPKGKASVCGTPLWFMAKPYKFSDQISLENTRNYGGLNVGDVIF